MMRRVGRKGIDRKTKDMMKRVMWILNIPSSPKTWRGLETEQYILQALEYHRKKKTEFPGGRRIIEIIPTSHFSIDDQSGKDAFVKFQLDLQSNNKVLPIQIRDWWVEGAEKRFKERGICLIRISLFNRKEKKMPEQVKKEAREKTFCAISDFIRSIDSKRVPR